MKFCNLILTKKKVQMTSYWRPPLNNLMKLDCRNGKYKSQVHPTLGLAPDIPRAFGLTWWKMVFETRFWSVYMTITLTKYANYWFKDFRISAVLHFVSQWVGFGEIKLWHFLISSYLRLWNFFNIKSVTIHGDHFEICYNS